MGIGITSFLEDSRSRGLTKHTIPPFRKRYLINNRPKTNQENTPQLISIYEMT